MKTDYIGPDVLIALAFGQRRSDSSPSNVEIAKALLNIEKDQYKKIPMIVQWEIEAALGSPFLNGFEVEVVFQHLQKTGGYLDSYEVIRQAWQIMKERGWNSAIIVAHPHHLPRCRRIAKWFGIDVIDGPKLKSSLVNIGYDSETVQLWTRNWFFFKIWTVLRYLKFYLTRKEEDK